LATLDAVDFRKQSVDDLSIPLFVLMREGCPVRKTVDLIEEQNARHTLPCIGKSIPHSLQQSSLMPLIGAKPCGVRACNQRDRAGGSQGPGKQRLAAPRWSHQARALVNIRPRNGAFADTPEVLRKRHPPRDRLVHSVKPGKRRGVADRARPC
jgi:hypothetical protein